MLIREYLKTLTCRRKSNARRRLARPNEMSEQLESRTLLTGNVQVSLSGANAQLTGDAENNEFEIVVDNGSVVVRGLNGTTINQGTTPFTLVSGATTLQGSLTASLGGGDDIATIRAGITFAGNVSLSGDAGADTLRALTGTYRSNLMLRGNDGATSIVVDGATVNGNLDVRGLGATLASISNSTVHGRLDVLTSEGADSVVVQSTTVDGDTGIHTAGGDDNIVLQNSTLRGRLWIEAGSGNDVVYVNSTSVARPAWIGLRQGNDTLQVLGTSSFGRWLVIAGGRGHDAVNFAAGTTTRRVVRGSVNSNQVDAALITSRITDPTTGAIGRADALRLAAVPMLTLSTSVATFSENAGTTASTLTVTRTGPTTADQVVTLTSSNVNKATVPATVTILAGQTTATATIAAVDNDGTDGAATVTITASATGFANATTTLTVNDNETTLTVTATPVAFLENAGTTASKLRVTRTGSTTAAQIVNLTSSNVNKATVPATVTIAAGQTFAEVDIAAQDNDIVDAAATVTITAAATGFADATTTVTVNDNEVALTVTATPATFSENGGTTASKLRVTRSGPTTAAQLVNLTSSNVNKATVPATVTIAAGQTFAEVDIAAQNNEISDGAAPVTITASATGFTDVTATLTVNDNETALTVTATPATFSENAGITASKLRVTRSGPTTAAQIVTLSSSNTNKATVPATVTIAAGQTFAEVDIAAQDNDSVDGAATVTITAVVTGFADATATLTVNDNETALTVTATPATFSENGGTTASKLRVTRSGPTTAAQIVNLTSSNVNKATVPATVTIAVGQTFAEVDIAAQDNNNVDGAAAVTVTAAATGFANATTTLTVNDNETALTVTATPATFSENSGTTASRLRVTRSGPTTAAQTVTLTSSNVNKATVPPTVTILAGQAFAEVDISAQDNNTVDGAATVTITAVATGFANATATLTVNDNETALTVTATPATFSENGGTTASKLRVTRSGSTTAAQIVNLTSSNVNKATVPATVTILPGQTFAEVDIAAQDNGIADGTAPVTFRASATGFADATTGITVNDNEPATLIVTPGTSAIAENAVAGTITYTVTRNTADTSAALTVNLVSANARLGVLAPSVTIPVGRASTTFEVRPDNNTNVDGNIDVSLTASAAGFADGSWTVTVLDDESATPAPALTVALSPLSVAENSVSGSTLTVTRPSGNTAQALVVGLTYSHTTRLSGPATITIPVGQTSGTATLLPIDNLSVDGNANVDVSASAAGFATGQEFLTIIDNETTSLSVTTASSTVSESSGTLAGTVATSFVSSAPLVVSLSYQNSTVLTGPANVIIPAGASSVPVTFTIVNGSVQDGSILARVAAGASGGTIGVKDVTVTDADTMLLTAGVTAADIVQSNGTRITRDSTAQVQGVTTAGATITVDSDGDGMFDDGSATANIEGNFTVDVTLLHTATNHGANRLVVKSVSGANSADTAVNAHLAVGTVVHFATNQGAYDVELLDTEAPLTVANFLSYVDSGAYQNLMVHRANAGSARFIQGGGFKVSGGQISPVVTTGTVNNEFDLAANSNVSGTLAMALLGDPNDPNGGTLPDSGTSQWFVNTSDNGAGFDSGKYTIFGRVIGDGLVVARRISDLTPRNLNTLYNSTALSTVPLSDFNPANAAITGTVAVTSNSAVVTGTGTLFTTELVVGQSIVIGNGRAFFVQSIQSDTLLTLTTTAPFTAGNLAVTKNVVPTDADFVVFSSIGKILDTI